MTQDKILREIERESYECFTKLQFAYPHVLFDDLAQALIKNCCLKVVSTVLKQEIVDLRKRS